MYPSVDMETMTWLEYREKIDSILILPVGATEQHGPHLPLCVDALLAREFAHRLAQKTNGIVAPALSYGYKSKPQSGGGPLFPGTIDLSGATLQQLAADLIDEFVRDGFTKIFIMNAHFENDPFLIEAMDLCAAKYDGRVTLVLSNWWDPMPDELIGRLVRRDAVSRMGRRTRRNYRNFPDALFRAGACPYGPYRRQRGGRAMRLPSLSCKTRLCPRVGRSSVGAFLQRRKGTADRRIGPAAPV